jgi:hypothetical protein
LRAVRRLLWRGWRELRAEFERVKAALVEAEEGSRPLEWCIDGHSVISF